MDFIKKILTVVWISVLLIGGIAGAAHAYPVEVSYYFQGLDIQTGKVFTDPTMIMVVGAEDSTQIEKVLAPPPGIYPEFAPPADVYFTFDSIGGTSLVVIPENHETPEESTRLVGLIVNGMTIEIPDIEEYFVVSIGDSATVTFITEANISITTSITTNITERNFGVVVSEIPEPSTLLLLGLGLFGLLGIKRWRKKGKNATSNARTPGRLRIHAG